MVRNLIGSLVACTALIACGDGGKATECKNNSDCNLQEGGLCSMNPATGNDWCNYPDSTCPSGRRWSDFATGDGLSGMCMEESENDASVIDGSVPDDGGAVDAGAPDAGQPGGVLLKLLGGADDDRVNDMVIAGSDMIVVGQFETSINLGSGGIASAGLTDGFVARYSPTGARLWSVTLGAAGADAITSVGLTSSGDVVVGGYFSGTVNFGDGNVVSAGDKDAFIAKYAAGTGALVWKTTFGAGNDDVVNGISVNGATGHVAVTGTFNGSIDLGGGVMSSGTQADETFVGRFDSNGDHDWSKIFVAQSSFGPLVSIGRAVATVGGSGDVVLLGSFTGEIDLGGGVRTAADDITHDVYVVRLAAANGARVWDRIFGGSNAETANGLLVDGDGDVVLSGSVFSTTIDFGGGALPGGGAFVVKLVGTTGAHDWSRTYGANGTAAVARDLALDGADVWVTGDFGSTVNFGGDALTSDGQGDIFYMKLQGSDGAHTRSARIGGSLDENGLAIAVGSNLFLAGAFQGGMDFGTGPVNSVGGEDGYLLRLLLP